MNIAGVWKSFLFSASSPGSYKHFRHVRSVPIFCSE